MEGHAADQLDVEGAQPEGAARGLPHRGEGLRQQLVEALAVAEPGAELPGFGGQGGVVEGLETLFQGIDLLAGFAHPLEYAVIFASQHRFEDSGNHGWSLVIIV